MEVWAKAVGQGAHVASDVAATAVEKLPAGHSEHALAFTADDQLPGAQLTHVGGPVSLAGYAVPGGHVYGAHTGALLPATPAVPEGHV